MVLNTLTVGAAVTPTVTKTWISHYLNRKPLRTKPTAHISYDLGLHLVRRFVEYSALHTVEELQAFTGQWVPAPSWVKTEDVEIDSANITKAAEYIQAELGPDGIEQVGGKEWWQWRRDNQPLKAEWIEMKADYHERKAGKERGNRVMLYVHGGAYYFGSVNEHRYQIQRHARKLKARCLAPRYRLAPQFPFPCGLHDCLAAYLYLLGRHDHTEIIVAGDSAGGGMALALLVVLRDRGLPLPAGGILLSPWVDLMHSFPSICGSAELDYIPGDGFMHKPSMGWPPPSLEDVHDELVPSGAAALKTSTNGAIGFSVDDARKADTKVPAKDRERGYSVTDPAKMPKSESSNRDKRAQENGPDMLQSNITEQPEPSSHLPAVMVDGQLVQIRDQIQLYSPNHLLQHPLVSPVLQPSLGGLPPILIQIGGGELLRDEQVYLAHKMANPSAYPPRKEILNRYDPDRTAIDKYKPTNVQVQLWEDMCHVGHTLSFTRPAKFMYRSVAQFGAWALAHAQGRSIDIPIDDQSDTDSVSSQEESDEGKKSPIADASATIPTIKTPANGTVGKAGDPLPPFVNNMIRQRVDRHGDIYDLPPIEDIPVLHIDPEEIGILKEGPVKKWLQRQQKWNKKFATTKRELQKKRAKQLAKGYVGLPQGEKPPPTALAGMRTKDLPKVGRVTTSWGMMMWSGWGSKHDEVRVSSKLHFRGFMFSGTYYENLILRLHCIAL
jgi:acetyl esterase/lipase